MQIKFLGTGGAFEFEKGTSAAIVTLSGKHILIDCGFSTILRLNETGLINTIDYILITHLHGDHVGSLSTLLSYYKYKLKIEMPKIIVPTETFHSELRQFLNLSNGTDWVSYAPIEDFAGIGFVDTTGQHIKEMTSFAYYFLEGDECIYYSGDIGNADTAKQFLLSRTEPNIKVFHETTASSSSPSHTPYQEVQETLKDHEVYAYHVAKENMPADCTLTLVEEVPELLA